jgi:hypothetical protein
MKDKNIIPATVQDEIVKRVEIFNTKYFSKKEGRYHPSIKGKFVYLMRVGPSGLEPICRLTYNGNINNMDFAIFKYSSEKYDANEFCFPGANYVNGTIEGAMKAGMEAYN